MDERAFAILRLHLTSRIGVVRYKKLLHAFGSPEAALAAPEARLAEVRGIGTKTARHIVSARGETADLAEREIELAEEHDARIFAFGDDNYPRALGSIYDPPLVLYVKGEVTKRDGLALAVVGTRRCTYYGRSQAERISGHMAGLGFTIVSGLARGVDSAAHRGALGAGGRTIAVLGCGLANTYPPENAELAGEIAASGAVVSEFAMEVEPFRDNFPRRNRVISGLSMGVLVIEGALRSGALITAKFANEQGRTVFALPGKIDTPQSKGPHALIRDGATLLRGPEDILTELGPAADQLRLADAAREVETDPDGDLIEEERELETEAEADDGEGAPPRKRKRAGPKAANDPKPAASSYPGLSPMERKLLDCLSSDERDIDDITAETELSPAEVSAGLLVLEIRRLAKQLPGKRFVRLR
jgi:DNA processing protein